MEPSLQNETNQNESNQDNKIVNGEFIYDSNGKLRYALPNSNLIGSNGSKEDAGGKYFAHGNVYLYTNQFITFGPTVDY